MLEIMCGLSYLHSKGIMHRDIKPANILVMNDLSKIKIADFGLSCFKPIYDGQLSPEIQTLAYKAPEVIFGLLKYDQKVDVWSTGCIFWELHHGTKLFKPDSEVGLYMQILKALGPITREDVDALRKWPELERKFPNLPKFRGTSQTELAPKLDDFEYSLFKQMVCFRNDLRMTSEESFEMFHRLYESII